MHAIQGKNVKVLETSVNFEVHSSTTPLKELRHDILIHFFNALIYG